MEIAKVEVTALEQTVDRANEQGLIELQELQLALIGGGIGEVIVA